MLFVGQICIQGQVGHPYDSIHGRPDFVTYVRQEIVLGLVGGFGGLFCPDQFFLRPLAVRDIDDGPLDSRPGRISVG